MSAALSCPPTCARRTVAVCDPQVLLLALIATAIALPVVWLHRHYDAAIEPHGSAMAIANCVSMRSASKWPLP